MEGAQRRVGLRPCELTCQEPSVGLIKDATQSTSWAMYVLSAFLLVAAAVVLAVIPARLVNRWLIDLLNVGAGSIR